ncbi:uncharacterized protein LOC125240518 [Leguminivora glycinivorella]|uniref:uncharacterized protein LOC125240518 n=1 Tax=Leguminivora glycinivorella TaxID=1035111 RepID=UPI00200F50CE|nr:uncharacterized protein LOC125240518 [Leguminivora glycinivorella]
MRSSPSNALQVECLEPPLSLRRQFLSDRFFFRAAQLSTHPLLVHLNNLINIIPTSDYWTHKDLPCLVKSFQKLLDSTPMWTSPGNPVFLLDYDSLVFRPNIIFSLGINKNCPNANNIFLKLLDEKWHDYLPVYTDASKLSRNGPVGSAVWIPRYKLILSFKIPSPSSVFTGEAVAIYEAVSFILSHKIPKALILSDSLSCLQDLHKFPLRSKDNLTITLRTRQSLHQCSLLGLEVTIAWIPSHSAIDGNEQADACAKQAIDIGCPSSHPTCYMQDLRNTAKTDLNRLWNEEWKITSQSSGSRYHSIQPNILVRPWFFRFHKFSKVITSSIIRLRLGHNSCPAWLAKIHILDHSICECGLEEGTIDHIFFNCPNIQLFMPVYTIFFLTIFKDRSI